MSSLYNHWEHDCPHWHTHPHETTLFMHFEHSIILKVFLGMQHADAVYIQRLAVNAAFNFFYIQWDFLTGNTYYKALYRWGLISFLIKDEAAWQSLEAKSWSQLRQPHGFFHILLGLPGFVHSSLILQAFKCLFPLQEMFKTDQLLRIETDC